MTSGEPESRAAAAPPTRLDDDDERAGDAGDAAAAADRRFMRQAAALARLSRPVDTAYCVGAVLVSAQGAVLSTGYSRELPGNTHAEECCLLKLASAAAARGAAMYTTMEPCGERLSGKPPCADLLAAAGVARCAFGAREPDAFVENCAGADRLRAAGVHVAHLPGFEDECLAPNAHVLGRRRGK
ncbi:MAG: cytidine deaminase-like protein [Olpidium bornovanus]|uniref:Cytidine deaminase-like protein n=1 Tax=Olpidium bornovanus TaxID=278681 RepID=A0A8H7ZWH5_9FUNG|nr:MAG: cytidine deaminase-like protein [Olpidium bornovanus]